MEVRRKRKGKGKWDKPYGQGPDIFTESQQMPAWRTTYAQGPDGTQ